MIIVERTDKPGMPIRIRLNDGNHDFTEAAAVELAKKLATVGISTPATKSDAVQEEVEYVPIAIVSKTWDNGFEKHLEADVSTQVDIGRHLYVRQALPLSGEVREAVDELSHIPRLELLRKIMQNVEDLIKHQSYLRDWWDRSPNWVRVQAVINNNTSKSGSMPSTRECVNIGIIPDGYSTRDIIPTLDQADEGGEK